MAGVVLGDLDLSATEANGVQWILSDLKGWGASGGTLSPQQKPRSAGAWAGNSYAKARPLVLTGACIAPSAALASDALDRLIDAASLDSTHMDVIEGGRSRWAMVQRDGDVLPGWLGDVAFEYSVQLVALDPRKHGDPLTASTSLPSTSGGLTVPFTVPFSINATTVSGQVSLTNPGNTTGSIVLRIDGPCVGPVITHVASGLRLVFAASLVLGAGEWIDVDLEAHSVLANGQSSRANWITSRQWFGFERGPNTLAFTASSYTAGALLTVTAVPAWS